MGPPAAPWRWLSGMCRPSLCSLCQHVSAPRHERGSVTLFLTIVRGLAWTAVYVDAIRIGFKDRSYAIAAAALALNFAWEAIYATRSIATGITAQGVFNIAWGLADVVIVYTFLNFGRSELPAWVTRRLFIGWALLLGVTSFAVQLLVVV